MKFKLVLLVSYKEMKIHQHNAGHMTKMAAMPTHGHALKLDFGHIQTADIGVSWP